MTPPPITTVYLALPMRADMRLHVAAATGAFLHPVNPDRTGLPPVRLTHGIGACSLLPFNFNNLWCEALNHRSEGITHFAMLHDDVCPEPFWLDTLLAEMARLDADLVSCVVPFKDDSGLTSTGVETGDRWSPRRLTLTEAHKLPTTFGDADVDGEVLLNTGCFIADLRRPWAESVYFHQRDDIVQTPDGRFAARTRSEDWNFSRTIRAASYIDRTARLFATTAVKLQHEHPRYTNAHGWGQFKADPNHAPKPVARPADEPDLEAA